MHHHVVRARPNRLLFTSWVEAARLWAAVHCAVPGIRACCLMPDHLHALHEARDLRRPLGASVSGFNQWRNRQHGLVGAVLRRITVGAPIPGPKKLRRNIRYVHLNPCRAGLVTDPLAWPFSTHRDALGLVVDGVRPPHSNPVAFHAYVARDEHVEHGALPVGQIAPSLADLWVATSAVTRTDEAALRRRGMARRLFVQAARVWTDASLTEIAEHAGVHRTTVVRVRPERSRAVRIVASVAGDPRFAALDALDLRRLPEWRRYRGRT